MTGRLREALSYTTPVTDEITPWACITQKPWVFAFVLGGSLF